MRQEVPARGLKLFSAYPAAFVDTFRSAIAAIAERLTPGEVAIAFYYCMRSAPGKGFLGIQSGMNAAEDYGGAAFTRLEAKAIATQGIAGMYSYSHHIAGSNAQRVQMLQGLITNDRIAK